MFVCVCLEHSGVVFFFNLVFFFVVLTFLMFASFLSTHFSHILFLNPRYFHLGLSGFCAVHVLISFVLFIYPSLAGCFFCVSLVLVSAYDQKHVFPAILVFLQRVLLYVIHVNCGLQF